MVLIGGWSSSRCPALVGVAAGGLVGGGLPPVVAMGVASSFLLGWVIVRAVRVLRLRVATDRPS
jgi:hypothetical protein